MFVSYSYHICIMFIIVSPEHAKFKTCSNTFKVSQTSPNLKVLYITWHTINFIYKYHKA